MKLPDVSVVIPVFNGGSYLSSCLNSVLAQTLDNIEILVVDDGSADDSPEIVRNLSRRDARVRLLSHDFNENRGVSASRQRGVENAAGKFIAFLDADDEFMPDKLERQVSVLNADPGCVLCHSAIVAIGNTDEAKAFEYVFNFSQDQYQYSFHKRDDALKRNVVCNSSVVARADAMKESHVCFPQLFQTEDWLNWMRLSLRGDFVFIPSPLTRYRIHDASATGQILRSPLASLYSRFEFLLTAVAFVDDAEIRQRAEREIKTSVTEMLQYYLRDKSIDAIQREELVDAQSGSFYAEAIQLEKLASLNQQLVAIASSEELLRQSWSYRIGHGLLAPLRIAKSLVRL